MKLHEYQAKGLLRDYGIPVPEGKTADTPAEAEAIAREIGCPVMIKAQVLVGGRGKAGGVKMAADPKTQEWWRECVPCQIRLPDTPEGEQWRDIPEVYHLD